MGKGKHGAHTFVTERYKSANDGCAVERHTCCYCFRFEVYRLSSSAAATAAAAAMPLTTTHVLESTELAKGMNRPTARLYHMIISPHSHQLLYVMFYKAARSVCYGAPWITLQKVLVCLAISDIRVLPVTMLSVLSV